MPAFSLSFGRPPEYPAPAAPVNREHRQRGRRCAGLGGPVGWPAWLGSLARWTPWAQRGARRALSRPRAKFGVVGAISGHSSGFTKKKMTRARSPPDNARIRATTQRAGLALCATLVLVRGTQQLASYTAPSADRPQSRMPPSPPQAPPPPPRARLRRNGAAGALRPCRTAPHSGRSWP